MNINTYADDEVKFLRSALDDVKVAYIDWDKKKIKKDEVDDVLKETLKKAIGN